MLPLAIVFGGWVEYRSLSKARKHYLEVLIASISEIQAVDCLANTLQHWYDKTQKNTMCRKYFSKWHAAIPRFNITLTSFNLNTNNNNNNNSTKSIHQLPTTSPYHLKSMCFSVWQSWAIQHHQQQHNLLFQTFVSWSEWTIETRLRNKRQQFALLTTFRKRKHRALSQWRLATRLSMLQQRHTQHEDGSDSEAANNWSSTEELLNRKQRTFTSRLIPYLEHQHLHLCWSLWKNKVMHHFSFIYLERIQIKSIKNTALKELSSAILLQQWIRQRRLRRTIKKWKYQLQKKRDTISSFQMRTIGRHALDRWLFVHVQRQNNKIISSPKNGYKKLFGGRRAAIARQQIKRMRTLHLPNRKSSSLPTEIKEIKIKIPIQKIEAETNRDTPPPIPPRLLATQASPPPLPPRRSLATAPLPPPLPFRPRNQENQENQAPMSIIQQQQCQHLHSSSSSKECKIWNTTFDRLSCQPNGTYVSGDVVLHLFCRIGIFRLGYLRSLGGLYSLMQSIIGNKHDFGFESLHLTRDHFKAMLNQMLLNYCNSKMKSSTTTTATTPTTPTTTPLVASIKMISMLNKRFQKDESMVQKNRNKKRNSYSTGDNHSKFLFFSTSSTSSQSELFASVSKIVCDKHERSLWSIFKQYGHRRGNNGVMSVTMKAMLTLAEDRHMIGASTTALHSGITRRKLFTVIEELVTKSKGVNVGLSKARRGYLSFPDFCILVAHLSLIAPDFSSVGFSDRLEQMLRTCMRI